MKNLRKIILFSLVVITLFLARDILALNKEPFSIFLDEATIQKGYTVSAFSDELKLSLVPGILNQGTDVLIEEISDMNQNLPWGLDILSPILQFEFKNKAAYDNHKPFYIQFSYQSSNPHYKQVFFYDKNYNAWRPLPTWDFPEENFVRSLIHLPYARIAVFSYPDLLSVGQASWYRYKGGDFAASPDFPKGSVLRVKNIANGKFVDVTINDFGPDRGLFPDRVIDLDRVAFKKIASPGEGLIKVSLEPLKVPAGDFGKNILINNSVGPGPEIKSLSAVLMKEGDGSWLYEKNADQVLPIASLSKLLSTYIFLEVGNSSRLEEWVKYDIKDEQHNLQYFPKWELALINLNQGDLLSIKDLIYSALVRSANNVVETLVRNSGLSRNEFIKKINSWTIEQGASSFDIKEPTGLDKNNKASARDVARVSSIIFKNPIISNASVSKSYSFRTRNDNSLKLRYNSSDLVLKNNFNNFKITGSKTGFLDEAGYCLVTQAEIKGEKYIAVILKADSREQSFSETIDLFNYAFHLNK